MGELTGIGRALLSPSANAKAIVTGSGGVPREPDIPAVVNRGKAIAQPHGGAPSQRVIEFQKDA